MTRCPEKWNKQIRVQYLSKYVLQGTLNIISNDPSGIIPNSDIIILAVPHIAREQVLEKIKIYVKSGTWVGSFPGFAGFAWQAKSILPNNVNLFGLQVNITGIRPKNFVASIPSNQVNIISELLRQIMNLYVVPVPNYLNICFSRSNSVHHPARIYSWLKNWDGKSAISKKQIKFYGDWNEVATDVFLKLDNEIKCAIQKIPLDLYYAQPVLQYYEVAFKKDLTKKMKSIRAMHKNYIPLIKIKDGYKPDLNSYFFTEDISYGLIVLKSIMLLVNIETPEINEIIEWGQKLLDKEFMVNGELKGKDIFDIAIPQHYGINSLEELIIFCSS